MRSPGGIVFLLLVIPFNICLVSASGKRARGLAFRNPAQYLQHWNSQPTSQISWAYNWASYADNTFPHDRLEFVPMLWGLKSELTSSWVNNANVALNQGSTHLLSFNEPDACFGGQSCMTVTEAVAAYKQYMMPFAHRAKLGAPVVSNGGNGMKWLEGFLNECTGCQIDFVPIHWYDKAINFDYFEGYVADAAKVAQGKPIWITEFNGAGTLDEQIAFLQTVMPWLDSQPYIERYAWFWCDPNWKEGTLVQQNGFPTPFGYLYANSI